MSDLNANKSIRFLAILSVTFLTFLILTLAFAPAHEPGKKVYDARCASCHGDDGKGETKAGKMTKTPDITQKDVWKQGTSVAELVKTLEEGLGKMPKYEGKLSAEELKAVSEYTLELSGIE